MIKQQRLVVALAFFLVLGVAAACGGGASEPEPEEASSEASLSTAVSSPTPGVSSATATPTPTPLTPALTGDEKPAPELVGISSWINSDPFTLESKLGQVVLVDFWTYTCINCIRTFPYLREWHEKYADAGLVIVGVHTPEFEFEKIRENVVDAVGKFGLKYPVAQDNDFATWRAFENRFWPAKYLIDKDGVIRYTHFGEGAYDETEQKIRELLADTGADLSGISMTSDPEPEVDPDARSRDPDVRLTRELYAGYSRNYGVLRARSQPPYVRHSEYYEQRDADIQYTDPGEHLNQFIYLNGLWHNEPERLVHAQETENYEDYIVLMFFATSVNAVMSPKTTEPFTVRLTIDGAPMRPEQAGSDVMFDADGNSYVLVDEARMYRLVDQPRFSGHELKLSSNSPEFSLFAFTFGGYMGGEPES